MAEPDEGGFGVEPNDDMVATTTANAILTGLDPSELAILVSASEEVPLERGGVIAEAGETPTYVYFPTEGVLSLVGATNGGSTVEVAVVGPEGVASISALLGDQQLPFRVVTQVPGRAIRISTDVASELMTQCGDFHHRLMAYTHQMIAQVAQSAVCNRFHNAKQRLARWLLMTADRADSNELPLTHEFISYMVGGPRSAVTEAAAELRETGAIAYRRGLITISSPEKLREQSCECYELLGDPRTTRVVVASRASSAAQV
jgi:CRP-like cAMP-binding protein